MRKLHNIDVRVILAINIKEANTVDTVFCRTVRKRWRNLTADHRLHLSKGVSVFIGSFGCVCLGFYFFHLEETPVTLRTRFMPISHRQMEELTEMKYKRFLEEFADHILSTSHPDHHWVFRVAKRLVMANQSKEMEHLSWQVHVVDSEEMNAFVLPVSCFAYHVSKFLLKCMCRY